ncbi:MAG: pyridine nucleotide-disulfide oxidoreductase [Pseudonocardia sp. SCN 72-86]|uniref:flavin-containing monooxygenase n=1 Tax=uncultured Microbacterium sp. TaxID=191216 RepID=UPI000869E263|nr:NAD(P)/FAD-dependent oxidoreductase [uncultured Microbacterium sp.]ODU04692.1 MAG: pyridine nucleotide-disulfide oxidoreductase [Pseudonocardia sp. SCN 72-86]
MTGAGLSHRRAIIVGAGQAGLAVAAALIAEGLRPQQDFVVIDAAPEGHRSWASRWHSMVLLSDARRSGLPVQPVPGDRRRHPRADEILDYLEGVQAGLGVKPVWGVRALDVRYRGSGTALILATTEGEIQTRNIVCATGAAARPRLPEWAAKLKPPGLVIHSSDYHFPRQVPAGDVLIVGGGNSGCELARELAGSHTVTLATRTPRRHRPVARYPSGPPGLFAGATREQPPEPVFGDSYQDLRRSGITLAPAVTGTDGATVTFAGAAGPARVGSVILATGYEPGDDWLPEDVRTERSRRALTALPGLFVAGFPAYSSRRNTNTLAGVWRDAAAIARHIINRP